MNAPTATGPNRCARFHGLHHRPGRPLLLPNAWDHASAAALVERGFTAVGTTSLGVAAAAGLPDAVGATREQTVALALDLVRLDAMISVDLEGGFGSTPEETASLAAALADAGVAGVNIEDGRPDGTLADTGCQSELIAAVRERAPRLFVNARTDTHWSAGGDRPPSAAETLRRAEAYLRAGADGVFVPGLADEDRIAGLAADLDAPLNILIAPGLTLARLADLGVRRVSCGSLLFRAALRAAMDTAWGIAHPDAEPGPLPSYADAQALANRFR